MQDLDRIKQYRGQLTPELAVRGIAAAKRNANRLLADAELLLQNGREASASALAILALEEIGKVRIIRRIALFRDAKDLKEAWKEYRTHAAKNLMWILPSLILNGKIIKDELIDEIYFKDDHARELDVLKQILTYSDCLGEPPYWNEPHEIADIHFAKALVRTAEILNVDDVTTVREIELWVEYVGPHYGKPSMHGAMIQFNARLYEEGLGKLAPEIFDAFMSGEPFNSDPNTQP